MATRHLYNIHTVGATLLYALQQGKNMLAIQAFKEIFVSDELAKLWNLLSLAWFLAPPDHAQQKNRYEAFVAADAPKFLQSLLSSAEELPLPPAYESMDPPKETRALARAPASWKKWPAGWTEGQAGTLYYAVKNALERGTWRRATRLTAPFLDGNRLSVAALLKSLGVAKELTDVFCTTVYLPLSIRILEHAFASLIAKPCEPNRYPLDLVTDNTRTQRNWSVSPQACALWGVAAPSTTELIGSPLLITKDATTFWKHVVDTFGVTTDSNGLVMSDYREEEFYDTYFPSDIPDEWSSTEREKSHGFTVPAAIPENSWKTAFLLCWS